MSFLRDSGWAYAASWTHQAFSVLGTLVLAIFIGPEGIGLFAMAAVMIALMTLLVDQGLTIALIQMPDLEDDHSHVTFWFSLAVGAVLTVLSVAVSDLWAGLYGEPTLEALVIALAPVLLLSSLQVVPRALMRRESRFRDIAAVNAVSLILGAVLAIAAVLAGADIWALVVQHLATQTVLTLMLWRMTAYRPRMRFSGAHFRALLPVSSGAFAGSIGQFARLRADVLVIGFVLGPVAVGLFRLAVRLQEVALTVTMRPAATVTLTHAARAKGDGAEIRRTLGGALRLATSFAVPVLGLLAGLAGPVLAVLGPDWAPARPALMALAVAGLPASAMFFVPPVLNAAGRSWLAARWTLLTAVAAAGGFLLIGWLTAEADAAVQGLALGLVVLAVNLLVSLPYGAALVGRVAPVGIGDFLWPVARALPLGLAGFAVSFGLDMAGQASGMTADWPALVRLALLGTLGGLAVLGVMWAGYPDLVRDYLRPALRRVRAKLAKLRR